MRITLTILTCSLFAEALKLPSPVHLCKCCKAPFSLEKYFKRITALGLTVSALTLGPHASCSNDNQPKLISDVFNVLERSYMPTLVNPTPPQEILEEAAVVSALQILRDPYTELLPKDGAGSIVASISNGQQQTGVLGLVLVKDSKNPGSLTVISVDPQSSAEFAGLRVGDNIISIEGRPIDSTKTIGELSALLRGSGAASISRDGLMNTFDVHLTLEPPVSRASLSLAAVVPKKGSQESLLYLRLDDFGAGASREVAAALEASVNQEDSTLGGVVLDLRNNPGGRLDSAVEISSMFLPEGTPIASICSGGDESVKLFAEGGKLVDDVIPVSVLVNS